MKAGDKNCLVARSQCYLQLGDAESALADAELTLVEEPEFIKVIREGGEREREGC